MVHPFLVILKVNQRLVLVIYSDGVTLILEIITGHLEYGLVLVVTNVKVKISGE